ncbi:PhzF family phenazine biosynthesis protein [Terasakiella sp. SH-1]|uniref:PhzF family phenazine biosynthesis protein n=1 Tax=Terasakiella sp. SH-1 TaxID=2560057 RepID=UPI001072F275|nr:PhzF family phenazine biosynthesis protein [Terasakiella sp. SH-1]
MMINIYQVDAFANSVFEGNPAAVIPLEKWLDDTVMQNIAAENNLAETAFFVPEGNKFHLRWFTPTVEIPLCGHATLASAFIAYSELGYREEEIVFSSMSGDLTVRRQDEGFVLNFPKYDSKHIEVPEGLSQALGFEPQEVLACENSIFAIVRAKNEEQVKNCSPDFPTLQSIAPGNFIITAPSPDYDFVSRVFVPEHGIPEDPVTGSAHCISVPYWAKILGKQTLHARQISKRGGDLRCDLKETRLEIYGKAVLYMKGSIYI